MSKANKYREAHPEWFDEKGRPHVWVLRELLDYNPETGELRWKKRDVKWFDGDMGRRNNWNSRYSGVRAGCVVTHRRGTKQIVVSVFKQMITGLVAAHALEHGRFYDGTLVSKNGDATDIRACNITSLSGSANSNMRDAQSFKDKRASMYFGVSRHKSTGKWSAFFMDGRNTKYLGIFFSEERAAAEYDKYIIENGLSNYRNEISVFESEPYEIAAKRSHDAKRRIRLAKKCGAGSKKSKFIGVKFDGRRNHWVARITVLGRQKHIGSFLAEHEAADAYDAAARKYFGPDAFQNLAARPAPVSAPEPLPVQPAAPINANPTDGDDF